MSVTAPRSSTSTTARSYMPGKAVEQKRALAFSWLTSSRFSIASPLSQCCSLWDWACFFVTGPNFRTQADQTLNLTTTAGWTWSKKGKFRNLTECIRVLFPNMVKDFLNELHFIPRHKFFSLTNEGQRIKLAAVSLYDPTNTSDYKNKIHILMQLLQLHSSSTPHSGDSATTTMQYQVSSRLLGRKDILFFIWVQPKSALWQVVSDASYVH